MTGDVIASCMQAAVHHAITHAVLLLVACSEYCEVAAVVKMWEKWEHNNIYMILIVPLDHLLLDKAANIGPLISRWELDKFRKC